MAGIWKRGNYWRAEIRRVGFPSQWSTFDTKAEAEAWARRIESEMDRGVFVDRTEAERNTFEDLLRRYAEEVSPLKKGGADEILRISKVCRDPIAQYKVAALSGKIFADYRDRRLKGDAKHRPVTGSTVNRELTLLSHVLNVARKEWGERLARHRGRTVQGLRDAEGLTLEGTPGKAKPPGTSVPAAFFASGACAGARRNRAP